MDKDITKSDEVNELWKSIQEKYKVIEDRLRPGVYKYGCLDEETLKEEV